MAKNKRYVQTAFLDPLSTEIGTYEVMTTSKKGEKDMARLADFGKIDRGAVSEPIDSVLGLELTIEHAEVRKGNYGEFVLMTCVDKRGTTHHVSTGAFLIVDAIKDALDQDAFPLNARFEKRGRTYIFS